MGGDEVDVAWQLEVRDGRATASSYWLFREELDKRRPEAEGHVLTQVQLVPDRDSTPTSAGIAKVLEQWQPDVRGAIPILIMLRSIGCAPNWLRALEAADVTSKMDLYQPAKTGTNPVHPLPNKRVNGLSSG